MRFCTHTRADISVAMLLLQFLSAVKTLVARRMKLEERGVSVIWWPARPLDGHHVALTLLHLHLFKQMRLLVRVYRIFVKAKETCFEKSSASINPPTISHLVASPQKQVGCSV